MTTLDDPRERLARALDRHPHADPDVERLLDVARERGTGVRRRRRATMAVVAGAAAAVVVASVGIAVVGPDPAPARDADVAADPTPAPSSTAPDEPAPGTPGPATARGAVAALDWALQQQVPGTTSQYFGQPPVPEEIGFHSGDYYAQLVFDDGGGAGVVGINVQFSMDFVATCENTGWGTDCRTRVLPGGGRLTTYDEITGDHVRRVADLRRPDGVRVVVSASNGFDRGSDVYDVRRAEPAFTAEQLATVVRRDFWDDTLPARFLEAGERLAPFREESAVAGATPLPG